MRLSNIIEFIAVIFTLNTPSRAETPDSHVESVKTDLKVFCQNGIKEVFAKLAQPETYEMPAHSVHCGHYNSETACCSIEDSEVWVEHARYLVQSV